MQIGIITVGGRQVGVVSLTTGDDADLDPFIPDLDGYVPEGRASETPQGVPPPAPSAAPHHYPGHHHAAPEEHEAPSPHEAPHRHPHAPQHHLEPETRQLGPEGPATTPSEHPAAHLEAAHHAAPSDRKPTPAGKSYETTDLGSPVQRGSETTDQAIVEAARAHHYDPNFMRSIASIESGMNPASNANRPTQYKGLFQMGSRGKDSEWSRFGSGNIYSAHDNAMSAARSWDANKAQFRHHFGRDPTETEQYMMHQQGLGFYTRGAMTNIKGNPYPGMHGPQTHESFEAGWGREIARRKARFAKLHPPAQEPDKAAAISIHPHEDIDPSTTPM